MNNNEFDESKINEESLKKYKKSYSDKGLMDKMGKCFMSIGLKLMYEAAQLYYVMKKDEVPVAVKTVIMGALGYLISPIDFIPDMIPVLGYTDDAAAIAFALWQAHSYIDDDVKTKAKNMLAGLFGNDVYRKLG